MPISSGSCETIVSSSTSSERDDEFFYSVRSIEFPRLPITVPLGLPMQIAHRWNNDDGNAGCSKKSPHYRHHYRHNFHRRLPKRYSDLVNPLSTKALLLHNESMRRENQTYRPISPIRRSSINFSRRQPSKVFSINSQRMRPVVRKTRQVLPILQRIESKDPLSETDNVLAHRMQAAMSSELMHSLDRNFVFGDRKQESRNYSIITRSQSFNICTLSNNYNRKFNLASSVRLIPRVQLQKKKEERSIVTEITPDYQDDIVLKNSDETQPIVDSLPISTPPDSNENLLPSNEQPPSPSLTNPPSQEIRTDEEPISVPPAPPAPLQLERSSKSLLVFRCRTIADSLTPEHKLILRDGEESNLVHKSRSSSGSGSKSIKMSRSFSSYISTSRWNIAETEMTTIDDKRSHSDDAIIEDQSPSPSISNSILIEQEYDGMGSSSSKLYQDYKRRTSSISIPTSTGALRSHHSMIIHPMHTRIGLRSSTSSSSTNEKLPDATLSGKQMNVCVINQLNEHLSTRFRHRQEKEQELERQGQDSCSSHRFEQNSCDISVPPPPPPTEFHTETNESQANFYDEPNDLLIMATTNSAILSTSVPPPPPPLPVGGFRSSQPVTKNSNADQGAKAFGVSSSNRFSREINQSDTNTNPRTSVISSNLSDTRILHELRANPLFTRAKQHLDLDPGSSGRRSGRRLVGSAMNLSTNETVSYVQLKPSSKLNITQKSSSSSAKITRGSSSIETIVLRNEELGRIIGKRTKSTQQIDQINTGKIYNPVQCRVSELEMIFQKRAQRHSQHLT